MIEFQVKNEIVVQPAITSKRIRVLRWSEDDNGVSCDLIVGDGDPIAGEGIAKTIVVWSVDDQPPYDPNWQWGNNDLQNRIEEILTNL